MNDRPAFASRFDFVHRPGLRRDAVESLIQVGAFDSFRLNRRELLWQLGLFSKGLHVGRLVQPKAPAPPLIPTEQDEVPADYELPSLSPDQHPMQHLRGGARRL